MVLYTKDMSNLLEAGTKPLNCSHILKMNEMHPEKAITRKPSVKKAKATEDPVKEEA